MTDRELDEAVAREWGETLDVYQRKLEDAMAEHCLPICAPCEIDGDA